MLGEQFLQKLAKWRPEGGAQTLELEEGGARVTLQGDLNDTLACRLLDLRVAPLTPGQASEPLAERVSRLASRITGLLEPLRLIEVDGAVAQLRSDAPLVHEDARLYYEVTLSEDGKARVQRFQGSMSGAARQVVPFVLTHEVLARLIANLTA